MEFSHICLRDFDPAILPHVVHWKKKKKMNKIKVSYILKQRPILQIKRNLGPAKATSHSIVDNKLEHCIVRLASRNEIMLLTE